MVCFEVGDGIDVLVQVHVASAEVLVRPALPRPVAHLLCNRQSLPVVLNGLAEVPLRQRSDVLARSDVTCTKCSQAACQNSGFKTRNYVDLYCEFYGRRGNHFCRDVVHTLQRTPVNTCF